MTESTKIDFRYRRVSQMGDVTDLVAILFPGNRNQQHAAARILEAAGLEGMLVTQSAVEAVALAVSAAGEGA